MHVQERIQLAGCAEFLIFGMILAGSRSAMCNYLINHVSSDLFEGRDYLFEGLGPRLI